MNISTIGSASWYTGVRSASTSKSSSNASASAKGGGDGVTISAAAFAALLQQAPATGGPERGGPPPLDDKMAARIGAQMKEKDPELFAQLDSDQDGALAAQEMEDGKDAVRSYMEAKGSDGMLPMGGMGGGGGGAVGNLSDYQQNLLQELLQSFAGSDHGRTKQD